MSFALFNPIVTVAAMACVALLAVRTLVADHRSAGAFRIAAICGAVLCNQVLSWQEFAPFEPPPLRFDTGGWAPALNLIRNTAPGLFMIQAHSLFVDGRPFPRWLLAAFVLQLGLELVAFPLPVRGVMGAAPAALQLMFGGLALYWTLAQWPADLVEVRRGARALVFVVVAVNMIAPSLLLRLIALPGAWSFDVHTLLSGFTLGVAAWLLVVDRETSDALLVTQMAMPSTAAPVATADEDATALEALKRLIDEDRIHLEPDLTLARLARRAKTPEYRLRRVIHTRLGHRNFNVFLHSLRIGEACRRLRDPEARRTPILTIALSVGYGSVNTFNRGFRAVVGCTPSDYRAGLATGATAPNSEIQPQILQSVEA